MKKIILILILIVSIHALIQPVYSQKAKTDTTGNVMKKFSVIVGTDLNTKWSTQFWLIAQSDTGHVIFSLDSITTSSNSWTWNFTDNPVMYIPVIQTHVGKDLWYKTVYSGLINLTLIANGF